MNLIIHLKFYYNLVVKFDYALFYMKFWQRQIRQQKLS